MTSMPSYPSYPGGPTPMAEGGGPTRLPAPPEVLTSVKLWFASIILGLVGGILVFALTDQGASLQTMRNANKGGLTDAQLQGLVTAALVVTLVIGVIFLALEVLFVLKMKAGRNWARIVLTVLAALSILQSLTSLSGGFTAGSAVKLISTALLVGALIFMFRPAANPYFRQPKA